MVVSFHMGPRDLNLGSLLEQPVLLKNHTAISLAPNPFETYFYFVV